MLVLLGAPVSLLTALVIEAGATGVRAVGFLIPGSIGVFEGGLVGIFALLGLESSTGLAFGVARRFREGVWNPHRLHLPRAHPRPQGTRDRRRRRNNRALLRPDRSPRRSAVG